MEQRCPVMKRSQIHISLSVFLDGVTSELSSSDGGCDLVSKLPSVLFSFNRGCELNIKWLYIF